MLEALKNALPFSSNHRAVQLARALEAVDRHQALAAVEGVATRTLRNRLMWVAIVLRHSTKAAPGQPDLALDVVRYCLDRGADPNAQCDLPNRISRAPLFLAGEFADVELFDLLLGKGAKPQVFLPHNGQTPLMGVVSGEYPFDPAVALRLANTLIDKGASTEFIPLSHMADAPRLQLLLACQDKLRPIGQDDLDALLRELVSYARGDAHALSEMLGLLLDRGADPLACPVEPLPQLDDEDLDMDPYIHLNAIGSAFLHGHWEAVELFDARRHLAPGTPFNARQDTPWHLVATAAQRLEDNWPPTQAVRDILTRFDPEAKNASGNTALDLMGSLHPNRQADIQAWSMERLAPALAPCPPRPRPRL